MPSSIRKRLHRRQNLLLVNLLVAAIIPNVYPFPPEVWGEYVLVFVAVAVILALFDWRYGRLLWSSLIFIGYLIWQIILSNLGMAWLVLQPKPKLDPGIIAVPLDVESGLETTVLASAITLTPGTISVDLGHDAEGGRVLYVHALTVGNPAELRASIKTGFERMILRISRG